VEDSDNVVFVDAWEASAEEICFLCIGLDWYISGVGGVVFTYQPLETKSEKREECVRWEL
jgi:hypothetical protein